MSVLKLEEIRALKRNLSLVLNVEKKVICLESVLKLEKVVEEEVEVSKELKSLWVD
jgi:hypothetical protein